MSRVRTDVTAKNKTELRKQCQQWLRSAREQGFDYVEAGYDPKRVRATEDGYVITIAVSC